MWAKACVRLLYNPDAPAHARLKSTTQVWLVPLVFVSLGLFYASIGGAFLYYDRRYRRRLT
jgi:hypothetical protein